MSKDNRVSHRDMLHSKDLRVIRLILESSTVMSYCYVDA